MIDDIIPNIPIPDAISSYFSNPLEEPDRPINKARMIGHICFNRRTMNRNTIKIIAHRDCLRGIEKSRLFFFIQAGLVDDIMLQFMCCINIKTAYRKVTCASSCSINFDFSQIE